MTDTLSPDLAMLRALVRGQLAPPERLELERWLVRHADEAIASALDALATEWAHVQADALLAEPWRRISGAFWPLAERGLAILDPAPRGDRTALLRGATPQSRSLELALVDPRARDVRVFAGGATGSILVATNDLGELHVLGEGAPIVAEYRCDPREGRITFWSYRADAAPTSGDALYDALGSAARHGAVRAVRITPALFDR